MINLSLSVIHRNTKRWLTSAAIITLLFLISVNIIEWKLRAPTATGIQTGRGVPYSLTTSPPATNMLDGCYHIYLDVGSNIGVQVRKLYEPQKYENSSFNKLFNKFFGSPEDRKAHPVCSVGFEPNPNHTKVLSAIEEAYNGCGWNVHFMTSTGVSNHNGYGQFYSDGETKKNEWGGGVLPPSLSKIVRANSVPNLIRLVRLSEFLKDVVGQREIPQVINPKQLPTVLMKMDIEGSEVDVLPDMLFTGAFRFINGLAIEFHERLQTLEKRVTESKKLRTILKDLAYVAKGNRMHNFTLIDVDDESYGTSNFALPKCKK